MTKRTIITGRLGHQPNASYRSLNKSPLPLVTDSVENSTIVQLSGIGRLICLSVLIGASSARSDSDHTLLWYRSPATTWVEALPIGNGSLGAMVFGDPAQEHLQFNEDTVWSGGPEDYLNAKANPGLLRKVRELLLAGEQQKAQDVAMGLMSDPLRQIAYQPFGDLLIDMSQHKQVSDYRRKLDLDAAVATVTYQHNGVTYRREIFSSYPDQAIIVRLTADRPNAISLQASLTSLHANIQRTAIDETTLGIRARVADFHQSRSKQIVPGQLNMEARLQATADGGTTVVDKDNVKVEAANAVTLVLVAATSYRRYDDISGDPAEQCVLALQRLVGQDYANLKQRHVDDHRQLFRRCRLQLGESTSVQLSTDQRQAGLKESPDPAFAALFFHYGRYLMIAGSRPGSQAVNLQGIWNDSLTPSWESKYTTNINLGMNYWPVESTNLSECHGPLFDLLRDVSQTGTNVAREHYAMDGWVLHHNTDGWRGAAPINATNHGIWPTGGAWLVQHLWWRYEFTGDTDFLRKTAYPLMKGASEFFLDWLIEDPRDETQRLISGPSNSPENGGLVMGPTMDHQIIRHLFATTAEAAKILDVDADFRNELLVAHNRIAPNQIGRYGQLQEWLEDKDNPKNTHRHLSHLWGLHPGQEITPQATSELADGCKVALTHRGMGDVGWSLAWQVNLWARLGDGGQAGKALDKLLADNLNVNLFDQCWSGRPTPFQIDANFGATAGIAEMLLQSHQRDEQGRYIIRLLPAIPDAWSEGTIRGLRARGGFEIDMSWKAGELTKATIRSLLGKTCQVHLHDETTLLTTEAGKAYVLRGGE